MRKEPVPAVVIDADINVTPSCKKHCKPTKNAERVAQEVLPVVDDPLTIGGGEIVAFCAGTIKRGILRRPICGIQVCAMLFDERGDELVTGTFVPDGLIDHVTDALQKPSDNL